MLLQCICSFSSGMMSMKNNIFYTNGSIGNGGFTHENNIYSSSNVGYSLGPGERIVDP